MDIFGLETDALAITEGHAEICRTEIERVRADAALIATASKNIASAIHNPATAQTATDWCAAALSQVDHIEKRSNLAEWCDLFNKLHKASTGIRGELTAPFKQGVATVSAALKSWRAEEERKRQEEAQRLAAEARKRDEDARLAQAENLAASGNAKAADAVLDRQPVIAPPSIPAPKIAGMSGRKKWVVRCTDKTALIKFIAERPMYQGALFVDEAWLAQQAKQLDGNLNFPGVEVYEDENLSFRRRTA